MDKLRMIQDLERDLVHTYDCLVIGGKLTPYENAVAEIIYDTLYKISEAKQILKQEETI